MRYKAFLSYSHSADSDLARGIESALQKFAKPWYRLRAIQVFRDESNANLDASLGAVIERALDESEYLLYFASPASAKSRWVNKEIDYWLKNRSISTLFVVLTEGDLVWDVEANRMDPNLSSSIPENLAEALEEEPLHLDLRWKGSVDEFSLRDPRFQDAIASISATLRDVSKEQLVGEDVRQHRRSMRLAYTAIGALATLLIGVLGTAIFAFQQKDIAVAQQEIAEEESNTAFARELAMASITQVPIDPELSVLLATQSVLVTHSKYGSVLNEAFDALQWTIQSSRLEHSFVKHDQGIREVVLGIDDTIVGIASTDGTAVIWDVASGTKRFVLSGHTAAVRSIAIDPRGRYFATASEDKTAKIWDAGSGSELFDLTEHTDTVYDVAFSADGMSVGTASADGTAIVWDVTSGAKRFVLSGHADEINGIAFDHRGKYIATASDDRTAKIWDAVSGRELFTLSGHSLYVENIAFSSDGNRVATASADRTAKIWDIATQKELMRFFGHTNTVFDIVFDPLERYLATASADGTAKVWNATTGRELFTLSGHRKPVESITVSADGTRAITADWNGKVKFWDVNGHTEQINGVVFSPDGKRFATASSDGTAKVWDTDSGKELLTLTGHTLEILDIVYSSDGKLLATASVDKTARIWDADSGKLRHIFTHDARLNGLDLSPDGQYLVTAVLPNNLCVLWEISSGKQLRTYRGHDNWVYYVRFSPDGKHLATAGRDLSVKIWNVSTGEILHDLRHASMALGVDFSPDGKYLASASLGGEVMLWDVETGTHIRSFTGPTNTVVRVAFSPDGNQLAAASWDRTAWIWDVATGAEVRSLIHETALHQVAFSPDNKVLATASSDERPHMYQLEINELLSVARSKVTRQLSPDECQKFLHTTTCPLPHRQ